MKRAIGSRRPRRAVAVVLALAAAAGSCTPGDDGAATRAAAQGSNRGGTLVVAIGRPGSVDPLDAYEPNGQLIARTMCDTLVEIDPRDGSLQPGLAASWQIQDNGTQISLRIREGARFSDGRKVTASDVAYSLSRAASPAFAGRSAELLFPIVGYPELRGEVESRNPRTRKELIGVRALTSDTVRIDLRYSLADAIRLFTHPVTAPVSKRETEADADRAAYQPVCSGPYRLASPWTASATSIALERVPGYEGRSSTVSAGGAGYADRIDFIVDADPAASPVDVVVGGAAGGTPSGLRRVSGPAPGAELIGLPAGTSSPFRELAVRRALNLAIDRERLVEVMGGETRAAARGFVPPTVVGVARDAACGDQVPARPDVARAKELLAGAPVELAAAPLQLFFNDDSRNRLLVEEVAKQWRDALGLQVQVTPMPFDELLSAATLGSGLAGPFRLSWAVPIPSADAHLSALFSGGATNVANFGRWNDPLWDRSLEREARRALDEDDRRIQYRALEDRLCETMPAIPLLWERATLDVNTSRVGAPDDTYLDPLTGLPRLREIWLR